MPSPVKGLITIFWHELRSLLSGRAWWAMLLIMTPLTGYGFVEATRLFGEASGTALQFPELARGMAPLDGILVPTMGAFYLGTTLLFPFVAIRSVGQDKESGAMKLLLQWPLPTGSVIMAKLAVVGAAWLASLTIPLSALFFWWLAGGHLALAETLNLFAGHALYALAVAGIAFFAATLTESSATAAIVALAFTLGFWVLDFAAAAGPEWLKVLGEASPTQALKQFERGLFSLSHALGLATLGLGLTALATTQLSPGLTAFSRRFRAVTGGGILLLVLMAVSVVSFSVDVSEDRRNSFNPADEAALAHMNLGLTVTLHLVPEDSRAGEYAANILSKLKRLVPHLTVRWADTGKAGFFGSTSEDRYGLITYDYSNRHAESRSNSPREILPLLHNLAGVKVTPAIDNPYPGYPVIVDSQFTKIWFYGVLPALILFGGLCFSRSGKRFHKLP